MIENGPFYPFAQSLLPFARILTSYPVVNMTAPLAPLFMPLARRDSTPRRPPPGRLNNPALNTFGPPTTGTAGKIQRDIPALTTLTNAPAQVLGTIPQDPRRLIWALDRAQTRSRARSCRERRATAGRAIRNRIIIISKGGFRTRVLRRGQQQVVTGGVARPRTVIRRGTKRQQRVVSYVH